MELHAVTHASRVRDERGYEIEKKLQAMARCFMLFASI